MAELTNKSKAVSISIILMNFFRQILSRLIFTQIVNTKFSVFDRREFPQSSEQNRPMCADSTGGHGKYCWVEKSSLYDIEIGYTKH